MFSGDFVIQRTQNFFPKTVVIVSLILPDDSTTEYSWLPVENINTGVKSGK